MNRSVSLHDMKLLIIDNSENSSALVKAILAKEGFSNIFTTTNPEIAFSILKKESIDLILLSCVLPHIGGTEVCKIISSDLNYEDIPIIMVTANDDIQTLQISFENGAVDYIAKPFNGHALVARVQAHLIRKGITDERKKISITDPLTSIYNRRHFDTIFEHFYSRALSEGKSISFFMADIDNFKKYNDNYGHQKGDVALQAVAETMEGELSRTDDYLFRLGGEEFAILLYDTPVDFLTLLSDNIHKALENLNIEHKHNEDHGKLSISMGVTTTMCRDEVSKFDIYNSADEALYKSKESGRRRTSFTQL